MSIIYERVNWKNEDEGEPYTPLDADNLNKMDSALDDIITNGLLYDEFTDDEIQAIWDTSMTTYPLENYPDGWDDYKYHIIISLSSNNTGEFGSLYILGGRYVALMANSNYIFSNNSVYDMSTITSLIYFHSDITAEPTNLEYRSCVLGENGSILMQDSGSAYYDKITTAQAFGTGESDNCYKWADVPIYNIKSNYTPNIIVIEAQQ